MARATKKTVETVPVETVVLSISRDIPFNKLILSQSNVRRIKAGVSIEELADDIARRTLLQSLTARAVLDAEGAETGIYEIPAGGRRFRALELLVKQRRLSKTATVPCVIREGGIAEEDSLAENTQRAPLHALDQFRAFLALREKGLGEEEIAAAFFVPVGVVKQRLRLTSVSPKLLDAYAEDAMTLDQLMAFSVSGDHARQEQVFDRLAHSHTREPYAIRRLLTEGAVRASDKRAQFLDFEAYEAAGGTVLRDLFQGDDGGWLQDTALVDRLVVERLEREAEAVRAEGWKWVEVAPDFPYGHLYGLRPLRGEQAPLTEDEYAARDALRVEFTALNAAHASGGGDLPDATDLRLAELETAIATFETRPTIYDAEEIARAGAFVSVDIGGSLRVERGFVRPADEPPVEIVPPVAMIAEVLADIGQVGASPTGVAGDDVVPIASGAEVDPEEEDGLRPFSDRLMTELTAHRTVALREALGADPHVAFLAALHALVLRLFYFHAADSCLDLQAKSLGFVQQPPGLSETWAAKSLDARQRHWETRLPSDPGDIWDALAGMEADSRSMLFAHCVATSVNATFDAYISRPRALAHAGRLAEALDLDMVAAGWTPTVDTFLGRVTKARILEAVRETKGERAAEAIAGLKKAEMAESAAVLLAGSGWLPEPLRTPGRPIPTAEELGEDAAANGGEPVMAEEEPLSEDEFAAFDLPALAAE